MVTFHVLQEGPVNALALNRDYSQVAIGGRNVFKIYHIEDDKFREVCNLRNSKHLSLGFSCNDVAWSSIDDHYLATAATNGHVCVWNLTRTGRAVQEQDYQDHKRTVNKVNFHAIEPYKLISGSQDGTVRYFDVRVQNAVSVFYSNTESIRDVQFSPHNTCSFCAVSDNGSVQMWDVRKPDKYQQQFTAHSGPVFSCDWHPECLWLATSSRDKTIKVWDIQPTKPTLEYTIHTIASIGHVKWRPQHKYQIASCALVIDCSINVWDIRRPYIPFASFAEHRDIASGVAWKGDPNIFLSSGRDCRLYYHTFGDGEKPAKKTNPQCVAVNNRGELIHSKKVTNIVTSSSTSSSQTSLSKAVGLMRKISTTQTVDTFHQASSVAHIFYPTKTHISSNWLKFVNLAKNYILYGRSVSEMCEHNAMVAADFGCEEVSATWRILKTMYGEEFLQDMMTVKDSEERKVSSGSIKVGVGGSGGGGGGIPGSKIDTGTYTDDQGSSKSGDVQIGEFSGAEEETENEDRVDTAFPNYLNARNGCLPKGDFFFGENEIDVELDGAPMFNYYYQYGRFDPLEIEEIDYTLPYEAFPLRHELRPIYLNEPPFEFPHNRSHSPDIHENPTRSIRVDDELPVIVTKSAPFQNLSWDPSAILISTLQHFANLGDVQTAATMLIVLGESRKYLHNLSDVIQEQWILGYIELLTRFKMWNVSTQLIKYCLLPNVNQLSQQSTSIHTNCGKCTKSFQRAGWLCDRCHTSKHCLCSICHQVVRGIYVWCQGCSHGGHLDHMRQWLSKKGVCPTGCGHRCNFN